MWLFNINLKFKLLFLVTFFLSACGGSSSSGGGVNLNARLNSVLVLGDSISVGENRFGSTTPWPPILSGLRNIPISNQAVSGVETSFGLSIIEDSLRAEGFSHVIIMLGTNDAIANSVGPAVGNLQAMADIANSLGVVPVITTLTPITNSEQNNDNTAQISNGIRDLSDAIIIDVRARFGDGEKFLIDGLHPNQEGQQLIAEIIASEL